MKGPRTRNLRQSATFKATPHSVYEMLMDSKKHAAFTGDRADISRREGSRFSAYGGWISGRNIKLVKDREIVQEWRGRSWPSGHYSVVRFSLRKNKTGTRLIFTQTGIPEDEYDEIRAGWKEDYWKKMKASLGFLDQLKKIH